MHLLQSLDDLLQVEMLREALHRRDRLFIIPLPNSDVDVVAALRARVRLRRASPSRCSEVVGLGVGESVCAKTSCGGPVQGDQRRLSPRHVHERRSIRSLIRTERHPTERGSTVGLEVENLRVYVALCGLLLLRQGYSLRTVFRRAASETETIVLVMMPAHLCVHLCNHLGNHHSLIGCRGGISTHVRFACRRRKLLLGTFPWGLPLSF